MVTSRATNIVIFYHGLRVVHLVKGHVDMDSCLTIAEESDSFGLSSGRHDVFMVIFCVWTGLFSVVVGLPEKEVELSLRQ